MCLRRASVRRRGMHAIRLRKGKVFRVLCTLAQLACYETYWQAFRSPVRYIRPTYATLCILTLYVRQPCTLRRALCLSFFNELDCFHSFNCDTSTNIMWKFHPSPRVGHKHRVLKAFSTAVDMITTVVHCIIQYRPLLCTLTVTWPLNTRIPTYCLHTLSFPTRDSIITMFQSKNPNILGLPSSSRILFLVGMTAVLIYPFVLLTQTLFHPFYLFLLVLALVQVVRF